VTDDHRKERVGRAITKYLADAMPALEAVQVAADSDFDKIYARVAEYRIACDQIQPAWEAYRTVYNTPDESTARIAYHEAQQRVRLARNRLLEAALDGRMETPR
jgi:threonine aldolase